MSERMVRGESPIRGRRSVGYGAKRRGRTRSPLSQPPARRPRSDSPCHEWSQYGRCRFGDDCKFLHDSSVRPASSRDSWRDICFDFRDRGTCRFGSSCKFVHDEKYARGPPEEYYDRGYYDSYSRRDSDYDRHGRDAGYDAEYSGRGSRSIGYGSRDFDRAPPPSVRDSGYSTYPVLPGGRYRGPEADRRRSGRSSRSPPPPRFARGGAGMRGGPPRRGPSSGGVGGRDDTCYLFRDNGYCKFGDRCKFVHESAGGGGGRGRSVRSWSRDRGFRGPRGRRNERAPRGGGYRERSRERNRDRDKGRGRERERDRDHDHGNRGRDRNRDRRRRKDEELKGQKGEEPANGDKGEPIQKEDDAKSAPNDGKQDASIMDEKANLSSNEGNGEIQKLESGKLQNGEPPSDNGEQLNGQVRHESTLTGAKPDLNPPPASETAKVAPAAAEGQRGPASTE